MNPADFDLDGEDRQGLQDHQGGRSRDSFDSTYATRRREELEADGVDTKGGGYKKQEVEVTEGGEG